jgi:hypothetical protein
MADEHERGNADRAAGEPFPYPFEHAVPFEPHLHRHHYDHWLRFRVAASVIGLGFGAAVAGVAVYGAAIPQGGAISAQHVHAGGRAFGGFGDAQDDSGFAFGFGPLSGGPAITSAGTISVTSKGIFPVYPVT